MTAAREVSAADRAASQVFVALNRRDRILVKAWVNAGYDLFDGILRSGVLDDAPHPRRHPDEHHLVDPVAERSAWMRADPLVWRERETCEHEAAHVVTAWAMGCVVTDVRVDRGGGGVTTFHEPSDPIDHGAILVAGEMWIDQFRSDRWPAGAHGCRGDRRGALGLLGDWDLREARKRARQALRTYAADVIAVADLIERERHVVLGGA